MEKGIQLLQHSVAIMLFSLFNPSIWQSPSLMFGVGVWAVFPVISLGLAGLITGIAFVFFPKKMHSAWLSLFASIAWGVTLLSVFSAFLGLRNR